MVTYPFKYDTRQYWSNFENVEENIKNTNEFMIYLNKLDIKSFILNLGNSLTEHELEGVNIQGVPITILSELYKLNENLTIINIDPTFIFSKLIEQLSSYDIEKEHIITQTETILHFKKIINEKSFEIIFSKSLLPSYDYNSWNKINTFIDSCSVPENIISLIRKYKPNEIDKLFVEEYYDNINRLCKESTDNKYTVIVVNYCVFANKPWTGKYFGMFRELLDKLSIYPNIHVYEYNSFKLDTREYSCIELKYFVKSGKYRAINNCLHTGIEGGKLDDKYKNSILYFNNDGNLEICDINNFDIRERVVLSYL